MLFLYDDARARAMEPFALTRPLYEMKAGALLLRRRWEFALNTDVSGGIVADHLKDFEESESPPAAGEVIPAGSVVANSRFAPALRAAPAGADVLLHQGRVAAIRLAASRPVSDFRNGDLQLDELAPGSQSAAEIDGWWLDEVWHFVSMLHAQLTADITSLGSRLGMLHPNHACILGGREVFVEHGARTEPNVVFDVSDGPIILRRRSVVHAFTRLVGPVSVGEGSSVLGDRVATTSIGPRCKVRGEVSNAVFLGYCNKAHDGFVGHSYLGRWVNVGAGTITSNLKNTYGTVSLWTPAGMRDTGMQFLGALMGDHVKTGIGTRLTTGTIVGAGANVFGYRMPPKAVPPFAWGEEEPFGTYDLDKFLSVAERAMARRDVPLTDRMRQQLAAAHAARWKVRSP